MPTISKCCVVAVVVIGTTLLGERSSKGDQSSAISDSAQSSRPRSPAEMRAAVTEALRATAVARDPQERDDAGRHLVLILLDLERDRGLPRDERLQLHAQVRLRLLALEKTLRAEKASQVRHSTHNVDSSKSAHEAPAALPQSTTVLAQVAAAGAPGRQGGVVAGPGAFGAVGNAVVGQSQSPDYGQDLVDLIH